MIAIRGLAAIAVLGTAALAFHPHMTVGAGTPVLAAADMAPTDQTNASETGRPGDSSRMLAAR